MQTPDPSVSMLTPIGYSNNSCGYCHNKSGSFSYYASSTALTARCYQSLLDRGWRRSGSLLYKPDQRASCCPQYTLRLDSHSFHASRDQRQSVNRFNKHVLGDAYIQEAARRYPLSRDQAKKRNTDFDLVARIHEAERQHLQTPPEPALNLIITLEPDTYTDEKYALFENYQRVVHHEPPHRISKRGFKNFLCNSPLPRTTEAFHGQARQLGSYHQCYRIDGKLVAVGVLDLLPQCVSAVYFMYHESVHRHGFGKLGALREIALAKEEGYQWWYSGFYIHSCVKMRYKGDYSPQYILDPESFHWDLFDDDMKRKLDAKKYISLSNEQSHPSPADLGDAAGKTHDISPADLAPHDGDGEDSEEEDAPVPDPNLPVFARAMPGILTKDQLLSDVDLDHIQLRIGSTDAETCDLIGWDTSDLESSQSIKGIVAELIAAIGPDLARQVVVAFR